MALASALVAAGLYWWTRRCRRERQSRYRIAANEEGEEEVHFLREIKID